MLDTILSPGPIKDWEPDKIGSLLGSESTDVVRTEIGEVSGEAFVQESLSNILSKESSAIEFIDSKYAGEWSSIPHNPSSFSISNPLFNSNIQSTLFGYVQILYSSIKTANSLFRNSSVLLSYRSFLVDALYKAERMLSNFIARSVNKPKDIPAQSPASKPSDSDLVTLYSEILQTNIPETVITSIPTDVLIFANEIYKALFVCIAEIEKNEGYIQRSSNMYIYVENAHFLTKLYEKIYRDYVWSITRDSVKLDEINDLIQELEKIKEYIG